MEEILLMKKFKQRRKKIINDNNFYGNLRNFLKRYETNVNDNVIVDDNHWNKKES